MDLLMITRKMDLRDPARGHSYEWANALARRLRAEDGRLAVICWDRRRVEGLEHVAVYSLKKEVGAGKLRRIWRFHRIAARIVKDVDGVFCHQSALYALAVFPWARLYGKQIISWYTHKAVTWKTRAMLAVSRKVLTASEESFRLPSPKVAAVGHGIDTDRFRPTTRAGPGERQTPGLNIVTVGRISPVKDLETVIRALQVLVHERRRDDVRLDIVGDVGRAKDADYRGSLQRLVDGARLTPYVRFRGPVPHDVVQGVYQSADLFVNVSHTGSLDKAVLEAMACECPVITSNEAFRPSLRPFEELLCAAPGDPLGLAERIERLWALDAATRRAMTARLRAFVVTQHGLDRLIGKIVGAFQS